MRTVTIPTTYDPFIVVIDNVVYSYEAGATETVPDSVADIIDNINRLNPKEKKRAGITGQVLTRTDLGCEWADKFPIGGSNGYYLKKTSDGEAWASLPAADTNSAGVVKMADAVDDADEDTIVTQFNALLAALVASGALKAST